MCSLYDENSKPSENKACGDFKLDTLVVDTVTLSGMSGMTVLQLWERHLGRHHLHDVVLVRVGVGHLRAFLPEPLWQNA